MPQPGSHAYDMQKQKLRKQLEDQGVADDTAEDVADHAAKRKAATGDSKLRPRLPPKASPSANPPGQKNRKPDPSTEHSREEVSQMTNIAITEMGPGQFGVEVEEGYERTGHMVTVSDAFVDDLGLTEIDPARLVRESVGFLLDREPATSIAERLSLDEIAQRYPDYYNELRTRLSAA